MEYLNAGTSDAAIRYRLVLMARAIHRVVLAVPLTNGPGIRPAASA